jgi:hypothetical protein
MHGKSVDGRGRFKGNKALAERVVHRKRAVAKRRNGAVSGARTNLFLGRGTLHRREAARVERHKRRELVL